MKTALLIVAMACGLLSSDRRIDIFSLGDMAEATRTVHFEPWQWQIDKLRRVGDPWREIELHQQELLDPQKQPRLDRPGWQKHFFPYIVPDEFPAR